MAVGVAHPPTALVLRALGLGDLLTAVPALRGVREALPEHRVVLATPAELAPLAELIDAVDEVLPASGLAPLAAASPEVAVNLHGRGPESHLVLKALQPKELVAFGCPEVEYDGLPWDEAEHEVARWCRLVETTLGAQASPDSLDLVAPPSPHPDAVVVHPGAAFPSRRWPVPRFAAVCQTLTYLGQPVVVTGSEAEKPLVEAVVAAAGLPPEADLGGRLTVSELAGLVASCRLLISGDTGVAHLASAYRRPSVVLCGPVSPSRWGPPQRPQHKVIWYGDGRGDPWGRATDPALLAITVDEVVEAAVELLATAR
jgi:ADP-heptose:LPS heptosyltransferase